MKLGKMIEELNDYVNGTLSIAHYGSWELHSYGEGTFFLEYGNVVYASTFEGVIIKAYNIMKEAIEDSDKFEMTRAWHYHLMQQ